MLELINKNLVPVLEKREFDAFAHGCNCFCTMGAGIAAHVKRIFPEAYALDRKTKKGDQKKLGTIGICEIGDNKILINAYTQFDFWKPGRRADYKAIEKCFDLIGAEMLSRGLVHLVIPKIGAGLAGGDWNVIEDIILERMPKEIDISVYYL